MVGGDFRVVERIGKKGAESVYMGELGYTVKTEGV